MKIVQKLNKIRQNDEIPAGIRHFFVHFFYKKVLTKSQYRGIIVGSRASRLTRRNPIWRFFEGKSGPLKRSYISRKARSIWLDPEGKSDP